ncbi:hypothetical protein [Amycolatopsis speibonae]|uniref:Uncharacterized protein n=1 Tax=Amycolatopsis speibonae TaxID=1450224 RepID=A0ABV7P0L7_9PSEU
MSASSSEGSQPDRVECALDAEHPHFRISEGTTLINPGVSTATGMVTASAGKLRMQIPVGMNRATLVVETFRGSPVDLIDTYDDVIEFGYWSATGAVAVLDWSLALLCCLSPLPIGAGDYRMRYHVRSGGPDQGALEAEMLIQIWPGALGTEKELKITSQFGHFWQPGERLRRSMEL